MAETAARHPRPSPATSTVGTLTAGGASAARQSLPRVHSWGLGSRFVPSHKRRPPSTTVSRVHPSESRPCTPSVCYSAKSADPKFAALANVRAIETLPPQHPVRTSPSPPCAPKALGDADGLLRNSGCGSSAPSHLGSPAGLFYDYDPGAGKAGNGFALANTGRLMLLRDADAMHTYFVVQAGIPSGGAGALDLSVKFSDDAAAATSGALAAVGSAVPLEVRDEPEAASTGGQCNAQNGEDCYGEYFASQMRGRAKWSWGASDTAGGTWGPLPLFGYCIQIKMGDVDGLSGGWQIEDYVGVHHET